MTKFSDSRTHPISDVPLVVSLQQIGGHCSSQIYAASADVPLGLPTTFITPAAVVGDLGISLKELRDEY